MQLEEPAVALRVRRSRGARCRPAHPAASARAGVRPPGHRGVASRTRSPLVRPSRIGNAVPRTAVAGDRAAAPPFARPSRGEVAGGIVRAQRNVAGIPRRITIGVRLHVMRRPTAAAAAQPDRLSVSGVLHARFGRTGLWDMSGGSPAVRWLMPPRGGRSGVSASRCRPMRWATRRPWSAGSFRAGMPAACHALSDLCADCSGVARRRQSDGAFVHVGRRACHWTART